MNAPLFMNKENFVIVTTLDGDGGVLTPLSVLAAVLLALPDLAAFPEVLGGLRLFCPSNGLAGLAGILCSLPGSFGLLSCNVLGKIFCVSLDWLKHHLSTLIYR